MKVLPSTSSSLTPCALLVSSSLFFLPTTAFLAPTVRNSVASTSTASSPLTSSTSTTSLATQRFDSLEDYEEARASFESLWKKQHIKELQQQMEQHPEKLQQRYNMLKERYEREMRLLKSLEQSDDAVPDLLQLWSTTLSQEQPDALIELEPSCGLDPTCDKELQEHEV